MFQLFITILGINYNPCFIEEETKIQGKAT